VCPGFANLEAMKTSRTRFLLAALSVAVATSTVSTGIVSTSTAQADSSATFRLVVPMYQSDQATSWTRAAAVPEIDYLVTLPRTLVVARPDALAGIAKAAAAGKTVLGYQTTGYAPQATSLTQAGLQEQVTAFFNGVPGLGGIFLDEVSSFSPPCATSAPFFQTFAAWFRATYPGKKLVLNAGSVLCSAFEGTGDAYLIFENTRSAYFDAGAFSFKSTYADPAYNWLRNLPNDKVWMIAYAASEAEITGLVNDMSDTAGVLWVSPYASVAAAYADLPPQTFLDALTLRARSGAPAAVTSTTTAAPTTAAPTTAAPVTAAPTAPPAASSNVAATQSTGTAATTETTTTAAPTVSVTTAAPTTATTTSPAPTTTKPSAIAPTTTTPAPAIAAVVPSPVALEVNRVVKRGKPTSLLQLRVVTSEPSTKVSFYKNGKLLKSTKRAKFITIKKSKVTVRYSVTITQAGGARTSSAPVLVNP
jgi:hypothetical protein